MSICKQQVQKRCKKGTFEGQTGLAPRKLLQIARIVLSGMPDTSPQPACLGKITISRTRAPKLAVFWKMTENGRFLENGRKGQIGGACENRPKCQILENNDLYESVLNSDIRTFF